MSAEYLAEITAAFKETLAIGGTTLTYKGNTKPCITGGIERSRTDELVGDLPRAATPCDMLLSDYNALGLKVREIINIDGTDFIIMLVNGDPEDPCVHLVLANTT